MMTGNNQGFFPCFSQHNDKDFPIDSFYQNSTFVRKLKEFLFAVVDCPNTLQLTGRIHPKGGIQQIDPQGNKNDKILCQKLGWTESKVYRVDYGNNSIRLLFSLDTANRRCYILALDSNHKTRGDKKNLR